MSKQNLAILFGGASTEHDVSRMSATSVIANAPRDRYNLVLIGITRDGRWLHYTGPEGDILDGSWERGGHTAPAFLSPDRGTRGLVVLQGDGYEIIPIDVVFPVLHGKNGEDGTVQGLLDLAGIPYVGCDLISSANCMDKAVAKTLFTAAGIPNAKWVLATAAHLGDLPALQAQVTAELGYPCFVKPANSGSSVGVSKVEAPHELEAALREALRFDRKALIEEGLVGHEVECAVMGNLDPIASDVVGEIAPTNNFYDYQGKYLDDSTALYIPARIDETLAQQVRSLAVRAYQAMGCSGLARVDFFVLNTPGPQGSVILNEINTLPGFTNISMYPKLFIASGMSYRDIITALINYALESERNG